VKRRRSFVERISTLEKAFGSDARANKTVSLFTEYLIAQLLVESYDFGKGGAVLGF
jgi:hypothetical protein